ncbi:MAG: peptide-methionine (S)-S-oxide reductase MsrA [Gemmataceae bacterium]
MSTNPGHEIATLGGGCFWCLEAVFENLQGVVAVVSGYMGGHTGQPTYKAVCTGTTGHAEVVQITFDPQVIGYRTILEVFFATHDPTTLNRQGADVGTQYRSAIFVHSPEQDGIARSLIEELNTQKLWPNPIVTAVEPAVDFFPAEDYHQGYFRSNLYQGYCQAVIYPKVVKFRKQFAHLMRQ